MTNEIAFVVFGRPQGKGSKRVLPIRKASGERGYAVADSNKNAGPWAARVADKAGQSYDGPLIRGPVIVALAFHFARPRSHYGTGRNAGQVKAKAPRLMASMPDVDKLARCALDALVGVILADDALIVTLHASKLYGEPERAEVRVREVTT